jgi:hypothetical protein
MVHEISEKCLKRGMVPQDFLGQVFDIDGFTLATELADCQMAQGYVDYVKAIDQPGTALFVEERLDCSAWLGFEEDGSPQGGTADMIVVDFEGKVLHLGDLKTGITPVAPDTGQLKIYALGAYNNICDPAGIEIERVVLHIYQPEVYDNGATHEMTLDELLAFGEDVRDAAELTLYIDAPLVAGETQCRWCPAQGDCVAAAEMAFEHLPVVATDATAPSNLSDEQLAKILNVADFAENFIKATRAEAQRRIEEGGDMPGWKLVSGKRGNRKWVDEDKVKDYLAKAVRLKAQEYETRSLVSPKAVEDLLKAGRLTPLQWGRVSELITQSEGKPTLAPMSDKRPALLVDRSAQAVFENID